MEKISSYAKEKKLNFKELSEDEKQKICSLTYEGTNNFKFWKKIIDADATIKNIVKDIITKENKEDCPFKQLNDMTTG